MMAEYPTVTSDQIESLRIALADSAYAYQRAIKATPSIPPAQIDTRDRLFAERIVKMTPGEAHMALLERCSFGELATERLNRLISDLRHTTVQNYA